MIEEIIKDAYNDFKLNFGEKRAILLMVIGLLISDTTYNNEFLMKGINNGINSCSSNED